jgi:cation diffusion facilitator CzcD-associated flavoprotein CzcO
VLIVIESTTGRLPVVVIGAGPVGLAAAARLHERGLPFIVLEAGTQAGASVAEWGHVRLFSPWRYTVDPAAHRLLTAHGWAAPDEAELPTGADLVRTYLQPLAALPDLAPGIRYGTRVTAIGPCPRRGRTATTSWSSRRCRTSWAPTAPGSPERTPWSWAAVIRRRTPCSP